MKNLAYAALLGSLVVCGPALASEQLATAKQCTQCHKSTDDFAGPSFHKIAVARKGQPDALKKMTAAIRRGSDGTSDPHWGKATMPNQAERPTVSQAEARKLSLWILKQ